MAEYNLRGLAFDHFIDAMPEDVYEPCPCGCGKVFRYVAKDEKELEKHIEVFIQNWIKNKEQSL
jgi:hypothetical protein